MRDVLPQLHAWWQLGDPVAVATVVATSESAPRAPGASLLIGPTGEAVGSVSGGCVEGAVYDVAQQVLASGRPSLEQYGYSTETAFAVGLSCGGRIDIFVRRVDRTSFPALAAAAADAAAGRPVAIATVIDHPDPSHMGHHFVIRPLRLGLADDPDAAGLDPAAVADTRALLAVGRSAILDYDQCNDRPVGYRIFVESFAPPPRMLVCGAIDFASALTHVGTFLGYRVTVCDARAIFATSARFPAADEVVVDWPHRYLQGEAAAGRLDSRTVLCVLTHDPKFDLPLLKVALRLPDIAYIGAMGSRRTVAERLIRLRDEGLTDAELSRLSSPIGLDLGARTPEQTAISIAAEILAHSNDTTPLPLTETTGPIHHVPTATGKPSSPLR